MACGLPFLLLIVVSAYSYGVLKHCNASGVEFRVGGALGWRKPTGYESETYNRWARRNRFHIGDSLYFKYDNDSVLVVAREDYGHCKMGSPLRRFTEGNTTFQLDRYGFFYFISGEPGHCRAAQKLIVRVMVHPQVLSPVQAPTPAPFAGPDVASGSTSVPGQSPRSSATAAASQTLTAVAAAVAGLASSFMLA